MDEEILSTVHSIFGKDVKIVDCEKTSSISQEEVLLINGIPVKLDAMAGDDAEAIKSALLDGQVPSVELLNQLLYQAGLLHQSVQLETSLSVKSSVVTKEEVCVSRHGRVLEEQTSETKEDYIYKSIQNEILQPVPCNMVKIMQQKHRAQSVDSSVACNAPSQVERPQKSSSLATNPQTSNAEYYVQYPDDDNESVVLAKKLESGSSISSLANVGDSCNNASFVTNCSNYTFSNATTTASASSSSSAITDNISTATTLGDFSARVSSLSCDSGHDGIYHSVSQSGTWAPGCKRGTANSLSSCYDIASSADETELRCNVSALQTDATSTTNMDGLLLNEVHAEKYELRKPQQSPNGQIAVDEQNALVYRNGKLVSGTLETLIMHFVPTADYYPDEDYAFAFLLGTRLFVSPHELLAKVLKVWQAQLASVDVVDRSKVRQYGKICSPLYMSSAKSYQKNEPKAKSARNMVRLLSHWMELFTSDFHDECQVTEVRALISKWVTNDQMLTDEVADLLKRLSQLQETKPTIAISSKILPAESQTSPRSETASHTCLPHLSPTKPSVGLLDVCDSSIHLAHQLTAIELHHLSTIELQEFVQAIGDDFPHYVLSVSPAQKVLPLIQPSTVDQSATTHLEAYVQWFNRLSRLIANEILKYPKKKQRACMIEYCIETARECFNIGNFNGMMAILAGLNLTAISRLKKTWSKVKLAKFSALERQMDPASNFKSYRSTMKAAVWRSEGATDQRQCVIIPFFTLFLKDLYLLKEGCRNRLPNNHVNFEMCSNFAKQMCDFNKWKQSACPYEERPHVLAYLQSTPVVNDDTLTLASFACEPPENSAEKERYKLLKSELKSNCHNH